jgi:hypothetical protein
MPFGQQIRQRWVGWWWPPSPALMIGAIGVLAHQPCGPLLGWVLDHIRIYWDTVRALSAMVSPLAALEVEGSEKPTVLPPRRSMAASKENFVRVEGS